MNLIKDLQDRSLLQDIMPGTEEQLAKEMTGAYAGFDPTADSLHVGNLLPITLLMRMKKKNGRRAGKLWIRWIQLRRIQHSTFNIQNFHPAGT